MSIRVRCQKFLELREPHNDERADGLTVLHFTDQTVVSASASLKQLIGDSAALAEHLGAVTIGQVDRHVQLSSSKRRFGFDSAGDATTGSVDRPCREQDQNRWWQMFEECCP